MRKTGRTPVLPVLICLQKSVYFDMIFLYHRVQITKEAMK